MISFMFFLLFAFIIVSGWPGLKESTKLFIWVVLYFLMVGSCAYYMISEVEKQNDPANYFTSEYDYQRQAVYELDRPAAGGDQAPIF